jgi:hypothetical protein
MEPPIPLYLCQFIIIAILQIDVVIIHEFMNLHFSSASHTYFDPHARLERSNQTPQSCLFHQHELYTGSRGRRGYSRNLSTTPRLWCTSQPDRFTAPAFRRSFRYQRDARSALSFKAYASMSAALPVHCHSPRTLGLSRYHAAAPLA